MVLSMTLSLALLKQNLSEGVLKYILTKHRILNISYLSTVLNQQVLQHFFIF